MKCKPQELKWKDRTKFWDERSKVVYFENSNLVSKIEINMVEKKDRRWKKSLKLEIVG